MKSLILNSASTAYSVLTGRLFRRPERAGDDDRPASFRVPARVVFRSAPLPRTQSGTVLKRDLRSAIASELRDGCSVAPAAAAGVDSGRVGRWLASHVEGLTLPVEFELVSGGRSNLTYRLTDAGGAVYALRRPPLGGVLSTAHDMSREWRFISALAPTPVPVAQPLAYCPDTAVTGAETKGDPPSPGRTAGRELPWGHIRLAARSSPARVRRRKLGDVDRGIRMVVRSTGPPGVVARVEPGDPEGFPGREQLAVLQLEILRRHGRHSRRLSKYSRHSGPSLGMSCPRPRGPRPEGGRRRHSRKRP